MTIFAKRNNINKKTNKTMSKFFKISDVNQKIFDDIIGVTDLNQLINYTILGVKNQGEVVKAKKANPAVKYLNDFDVIFFLDEAVFDLLTEIQRLYIVEDVVTSIEYNTERDAIKITNNDVSTQSGVLNKYTLDVYLKLQQTIKDVKAHIKETEENNK